MKLCEKGFVENGHLSAYLFQLQSGSIKITMRNDFELASIARHLSEALQDFAYTRKDEDKKRVVALQVELVAATKKENDNG
jgi:hypothetical protein